MIYEIKMPDLSKLTMEDEIEFAGHVHVPVLPEKFKGDLCKICSLNAACAPYSKTLLCVGLDKYAYFKIK